MGKNVVINSIKGVVAILLVLVVWVIIDNMRHDESLDEGFAEFFSESAPLPHKDNGFVALAGVNSLSKKEVTDLGKQNNTSNKDAVIESPNNISSSFKGDKKSLDCWISQNGKVSARKSGHACANAEQLKKIIADNKLIIDRITALEKYTHFIEPGIASLGDGWLSLLDGQTLISAKMVLDVSEGKTEQAIKTWLVQARILHYMYNGQSSITTQALVMIVQKMNAEILPIIVSAMTPKQVSAHFKEISAALDFPAFGNNGWNLAATMRKELNLIEIFSPKKQVSENQALAFYKPNTTKNRFYAWAKKLVELSQVAPVEFFAKYQDVNLRNFKKDTWVVLLANPGNVAGELVLGGMLSGSDLLLAAQNQAAYRQMVKLYVLYKTENMSSADMFKTIASAKPAYNNPLTDKPFSLDKTNQSIYFNSIGDSSQRKEIFYGNL